MLHLVISIIKLILAGISGYLVYFNRDNVRSRTYWSFATAYWFLNFLSTFFE